jgi:maleamate amidohydrolase
MTKNTAPRPWDGIISTEEQRAYNAAGFGRSSGLGKRPALLIIDVQYRTVGTTPKPFWEAIKEFPTACGDVGWAAVHHIVRLLGYFRERGCRAGRRLGARRSQSRVDLAARRRGVERRLFDL